MKAPNIIFITCDQLRSDALGCYGNEAINTPHIDSLAENGGHRYTNSICQAPVCTPARTTWLTGQYLSTHGVWANGVPCPDTSHLLPHRLRDAGYNTALVGKLHVTPSMSNRQPMDGDFGFDYLRTTEGNAIGSYAHWLKNNAPDEQVARYHHAFPPATEGDFYPPDRSVEEPFHSTTWVTNEASAAWSRRVQSKPTFMHISFPDPHHPFTAPQRFLDAVKISKMKDPIHSPKDWSKLPAHYLRTHTGKDNFLRQAVSDYSQELHNKIRQSYLAMIAFIDESVGRLVDQISKDAPNTIIVFTADHGEMLGDHGLYFKSINHYDGLLKIPLIIKDLREQIEQQSVIEDIVEQVDIMPTILHWAGLTSPRECQGLLLPAVCGNQDTYQTREYSLTEQSAPWFDPCMRGETLRSKEWKLSIYAPTGEGELYHLAKDPEEIENLWDNENYTRQKSKLLQALVLKKMEVASPGFIRSFRA